MKLRAVLFALLGTTLSLHAAPQANANDFSHSVPVTLGRTTLAPGDSITIDAIHGDADTVKVGNGYRVDGHYTLASADTASLNISVTSHADPHNSSRLDDMPESMPVQKGSGAFTLYFRMPVEGDPHLSFYPTGGGSSFASVYFDGMDDWGRRKGGQITFGVIKSDFSRDVTVTLGRTILQPGDSIVIDSIRGSADTIAAGNVYRVDGHYTLASQPEAQLAINVTSGHGDSDVPGKDKGRMITQGSGSFSLYFRMNAGGDPHLSFYPGGRGGQSFAMVYFNPVDQWAMQGSTMNITDSVSR